MARDLIGDQTDTLGHYTPSMDFLWISHGTDISVASGSEQPSVCRHKFAAAYHNKNHII